MEEVDWWQQLLLEQLPRTLVGGVLVVAAVEAGIAHVGCTSDSALHFSPQQMALEFPLGGDRMTELRPVASMRSPLSCSSGRETQVLVVPKSVLTFVHSFRN
jgi:hypothetical protein